MQSVKDLILEAWDRGEKRTDRTGTGTRSVYGRMIRAELYGDRVAVSTLRRISWHSAVTEAFWMLAGCPDGHNWLHERGVSYWQYWADENGQLGPIYGAQWRKPIVDPMGRCVLAVALDKLKACPDTRQALVSCWNPQELASMRLPPCHHAFHLSIRGDVGRECLWLQFDMRSVDLVIGLPYDLALYSCIAHLIALWLALPGGVGGVVASLADAHVYENHHEAVDAIRKRDPMSAPRLDRRALVRQELHLCETAEDFLARLTMPATIDTWRVAMQEALVGYAPHGHVRVPIAV